MTDPINLSRSLTAARFGIRLSIGKSFSISLGGGDTLPGGEGLIMGGVEGLGGGGPGGSFPCLKTETVTTYYLYDGGILVATFDESNSVLEMFAYGPTGKITSWEGNNCKTPLYYLNDQVGSPRVVIKEADPDIVPPDTARVVQHMTFSPFGEVLSSWGSTQTAFKFTAKELDDEHGFDHHYFGSRFYNAELGRFTSIDKAGQFASGFVYGGNNPVMGVDPDGNFFFVPFLVGAAYGALFSGATYSAMTLATGADWTLDGFGMAVLGGALSGGVGATFSQIGGQLANNLSYKLVSEAATSATTSAILGRDISLASIAGSTVGGMASYKMMGNFNVASRNRLGNIVAELGHSSMSGAISGVSGGMVTNALSGRNVFSNMNENFRYGAAGGLASGAANIAIMGGATRPPEDLDRELSRVAGDLGIKYDPLYRSGPSLFWLGKNAGLFPQGFAGFGRNIIVNETGKSDRDRYLWGHETVHYWQGAKHGWGRVIGGAAGSQIRHFFGGPNPYYKAGTWEENADLFTRGMGFGY